MTGLPDNLYSQTTLVSVVRHENWRSNDRLLGLFVCWAQHHSGLAWKSRLHAAAHQPFGDFSSIDGAMLNLVDGVIERIEIKAHGTSVFHDNSEFTLEDVIRLLWHIETVTVSGLKEYESSNTPTVAMHGEHCSKLLDEFAAAKKSQPKTRRLLRKLKKDPVLFFRDSDKFPGKTIYRLLKVSGLDQSS